MSDKTKFEDDYRTGDLGVKIFIENFVRNQWYSFSDKEHKEDYDIQVNGTTYEIKANLKNNGYLVIEEYYDRTKNKKGWIINSKSNYIVFINKSTKVMLIYPTQALKKWYKNNYQWIKKSIPLMKNKTSIGLYGDQWTSEFRKIPIEKINADIRPIVIDSGVNFYV